MSSILFILELAAFVLVVVWIYRVERTDPSALAQGLFAMRGEDEPRRRSRGRAARWRGAAADPGGPAWRGAAETRD